eukprot:GDKJ01026089.1.p1 GENE.GDKJ01026089.1~~GDKJ01026089.1.p1  ORF type:complete len:205 (+),score=37.23 GDKJ01026089.1:24-638(+)
MSRARKQSSSSSYSKNTLIPIEQVIFDDCDVVREHISSWMNKTKKTYKDLAQCAGKFDPKITEGDITRFMSVQGATFGSNNPAYAAVYHYLESVPPGHPYYSACKSHRNSLKRRVLLTIFRNHQRMVMDKISEDEMRSKLNSKFLSEAELQILLPPKKPRSAKGAAQAAAAAAAVDDETDAIEDVDVDQQLMASIDQHVAKLID